MPEEQVQSGLPQGAPPTEQAGNVTQLIGQAGDSLTQLMDLFERAGAEDKDKQALGQIVSMFQSLVQSMNGAEAPQAPETGTMAENQGEGAEKFNG